MKLLFLLFGLALVGSHGIAVNAGETPGAVAWREPVTGMMFQYVPKGCFQMGRIIPDIPPELPEEHHPDEGPLHEVCVDAFWLGQYEVTQAQWTRVMGNTPSLNAFSPAHPVDNVTWLDVRAFLTKLNLASTDETFKLRLPTEAEWEYACRSGGKNETYSGGEDYESVAWLSPNSPNHLPQPVGTRRANGLGFYDMSGNVWEWVADAYQEDAYARHALNNPLTVKDAKNRRVIRGGSYRSYSPWVRCKDRNFDFADESLAFIGFRVARALVP